MKILVIGSGGREHALCWKFDQSPRVDKIFCADGNAGISLIGEVVDIKPEQIERLADFAQREKIDLTFVGGETALAAGITDAFEKRDLTIIGASQKAARLEASKSFAKDFMQRHRIPTAKYKTVRSAREGIEVLEAGEFGDASRPVVVKADGLAAGKGVVVAEDRSAAIDALRQLAEGRIVNPEAAATIVIEEFLSGREVSLILFADGEDFALMPPVRDHKRIGEGDTGANTGGMGTVSDAGLLTAEQTAAIIETIVTPTLRGCRDEGFPFRGILFLGLMMTESGARVLEYNVRFGDPETQVIMALLKTDLVEVCQAIAGAKLGELNIDWESGSAACVVLASEGYPQKARTGHPIKGLKQAENVENTVVFHAGTAAGEDGGFVTAGGRVLGVTATGKNLASALERAYRAVGEISWDGMQFRRDIGQ